MAPITKLSQPEKQACVLPIPLSFGSFPRKKRGVDMGLGITTHLLGGRPLFTQTWVSSQTWGIKGPCTSLEHGQTFCQTPTTGHSNA